MKLLVHNWRSGIAKVLVEHADDLWSLQTILESGDRVEGHSTRKVKVGDAESSKAVRKHVYVKLAVEKVEFTGTQLRILGTATEGSDEVPQGSHHSLTVEPQDTLTIIKEWPRYQIERLEEACANAPEILICILDRDQATIAALKRSGYAILTELTGEVQRKYDAKIQGKDFFSEVEQVLAGYAERMKPASIVVASPAFWKEDFGKQLKSPALKGKVILATVSASDESALREVLTRPEVQRALAKDRISKEQALIEQLLGEIGKDGRATYGKVQVRAACDAGAVSTLLVAEELIQRTRLEGTYAALDSLMRAVERGGGQVRLIGADHDGGKKLSGLGGVAALLRYRAG